MDKKTYYCVTTSFHDNGYVSAAITSTVEANERPNNTYTHTSRRDIYNDWFDSIADAEAFVKEAETA